MLLMCRCCDADDVCGICDGDNVYVLCGVVVMCVCYSADKCVLQC